MSRGSLIPDLAIEWSGRGLTAYDPKTRSSQRYSDLGTAASAYGSRTAVIGLSRRSVFLRTMRVPNAGPDEIRQILMLRAADLFPIGPAELAIDFRLTDDVDAEGRLAVVCAVPTVELRRIREEAKAAGLRVAGVMPVAFGSASIARALNNQSAAIVSVDQEGVGIDVVVNGELRQSRVVPPNSPIEAEVCRTYSVAGLPCGATIAAEGVVLQDADADTNDSPLAALIDAFPAHLGIDLVLPEETELRKRKIREQKTRTAFLLAAAAGAVLIWVAKTRSDQNDLVELAQHNSETRITKAKKQKTTAENLLTKEQGYQKTLDRAFVPAQRMGDVLALVSNLAPQGSWLAGVNLERGRPVTLRGTAKTSEAVTAYLQALTLNAQGRLRDVKPIFAVNAEVERVPVVQFSISAFPIGNLPLADPTVKPKAATKK